MERSEKRKRVEVMLAKYSVKKPYTVLVAVVLALVLGVVSFFGMTTDLLPELELPYVVVVTAYPGADPEKVERAVTQPLEAALGTASGLSSISSVSQENSSMIILEFEQAVNMDSVMIELSGNIDLVRGSLDDSVGSPMLLAISPDMLPVMVASVDADGMDAAALSTLVDETISPAFERLDGVASVTGTGMIEQTVRITLDPERIYALSEQMKQAVASGLDEAEQELNAGAAEIQQGLAGIDAARNELNSKLNSTASQLAAASAEVDTAVANLSALLAQETSLKAERTGLEMEQTGLQTLCDQYEKLDSQLSALAGIGPLPAELNLRWLVDAGEDYFNETILPLLTAFAPELAGAANYTALSELQKGYDAAVVRLPQIAASLADLDNRRAVIDGMKPQLEQGLERAKQGYAQLESGKLVASVGIAQGSASLESAAQGLAQAQSELDAAREQLDTARETALEQADLSALLTSEMIGGILTAQNFSMPAGSLTDDGGAALLVKVGDTYGSIDELADTLLLDTGEEGIGEIRLSDVAQVELTDNRGETYAKVNGNEGVLLSFQKQSTASTAAVADRLGEEIKVLEEENPGLHITPLMDQGDYIHMVTDSVLSNLAMGGALAILVLILFLSDLRPTLIIAASIPISLMVAVTLMYFSGVTLNLISLSGLALGVGMLVDNSIVVIENIYRLRAQGMSPVRASIAGANQVAGAIFASTLTTVCVFLPIVFTQGISRQLFTDMGLTIAYSLMASLAVALTLVPALGSVVLRNNREPRRSWFDHLVAGYGRMLDWALNHRAAVLAGAGALLAFACFGVTVMGTAFLPQMNSNQMSATLTLPLDADSAQRTQTADELVRRLGEIDGVDTVGAMEGGGLMGGGSDGAISLYILLEDASRSNTELAKEMEKAAEGLDCTLEVSASTMDLSALGGSGIEIELRGQDLDAMRQAAQELADQLAQIEGIVDVSAGEETADRELRITVDKNAAMARGLTVAQVYAQIADALSVDNTATTLTEGANSYPVVIADGESLNREQLMDYSLTASTTSGEEETVRLSEIAQITEEPALSSIQRESGARVLSVSAGVADGYNVGLLGREINELLEGWQPPEGITATLRGENESIASAMTDLLKMIALAIVFIYLIMVAQFQSLLSPFIVLFTLPLAFTGGLLLLWVSGCDLSVIAMLGFLVLAGVVVNNGIVFVDYANQLRDDGMERRQALLQTGRDRIRPILMTALTTVLAMTTMALGIGDGAEMTQPMAIVTIGGLSYATLLTLFVVPVIYDLLAARRRPPVELAEDEANGL